MCHIKEENTKLYLNIVIYLLMFGPQSTCTALLLVTLLWTLVIGLIINDPRNLFIIKFLVILLKKNYEFMALRNHCNNIIFNKYHPNQVTANYMYSCTLLSSKNMSLFPHSFLQGRLTAIEERKTLSCIGLFLLRISLNGIQMHLVLIQEIPRPSATFIEIIEL